MQATGYKCNSGNHCCNRELDLLSSTLGTFIATHGTLRGVCELQEVDQIGQPEGNIY